MKRKHKRLTFVIVAMALLGIAVGLVLMAFEENIVFFNSPTDIVNKQPESGKRLRLGGLVEEGSVVREAGSTVTRFRVTDLVNAVDVNFDGILPDLFREGQGVITEGKYIDGVFQASEVLAKHDEQYMPPEVADALRNSGEWRGDLGPPAK
ncbi:MAG: cytochrome c maturation protein CcmE [Rhodospirillaceae bacterium]|nr:cytochrome c maturation protein CcmE [Rhodospirillaceae bacterium]